MAERILVRAPNWAGDVVMATPGLRALRAGRPGAHVAVHVKASLAPLLRGAPWIDEIVPLASAGRGAGALVREGVGLRARRFELGLCLPDSFSSALLMRCAGVGRIVGHATQGRRVLLHVAVAPRPGLVPREQQVLDVVAAAGCPAQGPHLELFVRDEEEQAARHALAAAGIGAGEPLALLAPGASFGPAKRWPPERFAAVGDALAAAGARVAVIGAPDEAPLASALAAAMRAPAALLTGRLDLGALKAVVRRARVLVCNDAGARHVAVAFGVPVLALFGPTSLAKTSWNLERVRAFAADVGCRPCYRRRCPIDHRCMTGIASERVAAAAVEAFRDPEGFRGDAARQLLREPAAPLAPARRRSVPA
ncbi:MAG: lipopolysaccharide heptosyltransferase II [Deltaproteobacteria bacterium]|nr:lipopolysaccharide heptosyltransferase II [Deltaproteobacteria bacterium]